MSNTHTTRFENTSTHSLSDKTLPTLSMITRTFVLLIKESIVGLEVIRKYWSGTIRRDCFMLWVRDHQKVGQGLSHVMVSEGMGQGYGSGTIRRHGSGLQNPE